MPATRQDVTRLLDVTITITVVLLLIASSTFAMKLLDATHRMLFAHRAPSANKLLVTNPREVVFTPQSLVTTGQTVRRILAVPLLVAYSLQLFVTIMTIVRLTCVTTPLDLASSCQTNVTMELIVPMTFVPLPMVLALLQQTKRTAVTMTLAKSGLAILIKVASSPMLLIAT